MAYGLKYFCEYKRQDQETTRIEIDEDGYDSYSIEVKMVSCQVVQGNGNAGIQELIKGTKVNLGLATMKGQNGEGFNYDLDFEFENVTTEVDYKEFYTQDETKYRVTMYRATGEIFFRGYILPDLFLDEYVDYTRIINFTASDRLNRLVDIDIKTDISFLDNLSVANMLIRAKESILLEDLGIIGGTRFKESTGNGAIPTTSEIEVNRNFIFRPNRGSADEPRNFEEILLNLAKVFFSNIFQWKGNLYFHSVVNAAFNSLNIAKYELDPNSFQLETIDISPTDLSRIMLSVPTIEGQPTARRARVVFKVGDQDIDGFENLVIHGEFGRNNEIVSTWMSMSGPGGFKWKLRNWTYSDNTDYTKQASRGPDGLPTTNYVVMHRQWQFFVDGEYIESQNRLGSDVSPQFLLRFSLKYQGLKTNNSKSGFEDMDAFFVFMLIIRNDTETHYLERLGSTTFGWTTTETAIRIKFSEDNFRVWNDFVVNDLIPPITGRVFVRLYNTQQLGSTFNYRFHSAYDDVVVAAEANDQLDNQDITFETDTGQGYSSFADDYEVRLGDFPNGFSESALMIDGRPTELWAFSGQGESPILAHILSLYSLNVTNPRMTIICRVQLPDLDITRGVIVDGTVYRINHWSLDDAKNIWSLELHKVYAFNQDKFQEFPILEFDPTFANSYFTYYNNNFQDFLAGFTVIQTQFPRGAYQWNVSYRGQNWVDDTFNPTENTFLGLFDMTNPTNDTYFQMVSGPGGNFDLMNAIRAMGEDWTSGGSGYHSLWTMRLLNKETGNLGPSFDISLPRAEI